VDPEAAMQKITPFLWFDSQAEEAAHFYLSVFPDSRITQVVRYDEAGPGPAGGVMTVAFELQGQRFVALNGGPLFQFNESISFVINCETQAEIDRYWDRLVEDGQPSRCGWLKDRFGVSWQVVPVQLPQLLADLDRAAAQRVMQAVMGMAKLDIAALLAAARG
jgi:predicted 3-demethylubiquinone-9 3-methyltransferase (glyoxalase superfamily)